MPNTQTSVPAFTAGQILTAQQQTEINTGIPVFASATTRNAAFGGTGEKILAEGQFAYLEDTNTTQYYDGAAWQTVGTTPGLVCVKAETAFTTASTINVNNVFSSSYTNYLLNIIFDASVELDVQLRLRVGGVDNSTANSYKRQTIEASGGSSTVTQTQRDNYLLGAGNATAPSAIQAYLFQPFVAAKTPIMSNNQRSSNTTTIFISWAYHDQTVSYDGFSLLTSTGTITGTYSVYGYSKTV
jgi:hypothetical protein